jgi:hypothetical protein
MLQLYKSDWTAHPALESGAQSSIHPHLTFAAFPTPSSSFHSHPFSAGRTSNTFFCEVAHVGISVALLSVAQGPPWKRHRRFKSSTLWIKYIGKIKKTSLLILSVDFNWQKLNQLGFNFDLLIKKHKQSQWKGIESPREKK